MISRKGWICSGLVLLCFLSWNWAFAQQVQVVPVTPGVQQQYPAAAQTSPTTPPAGSVQPPGVPQQAPPPQAQQQYPSPAPAEELSPFEQYVSGQIPSSVSFDIKQFGYDLFTQSMPAAMSMQQSSAVPGQTNGPSSGLALPPPVFNMPGQIVPGAPVEPAQRSMPGQIQPTLPPQQPDMSHVPPAGSYVPQRQQVFQQPAQRPSSQSMAAMGMPSLDIPVSPNYVIGPGDELRISLWGSIEQTWSVQVDRDGNIALPKVGVLGVTGLTFAQLKDLMQQELSKYYNDFQMNVSMGSLKYMRIYVVGNARFPGAYSVSSLSTMINALLLAGGPSKTGSMRDIQLKRNGETIYHLDLYDFLIRGDKSKDERLMPEDVVFIPPIGSIVGIAGNVDRPAIYELKEKMRLSEAIKLAGGVTAGSYLQRVQVERVFQRQSKVIFDLNLEKLKGKDDVLVEDGDIVKVFSINTFVTNKVALDGNVRRPGDYEWRQGMKVKDILTSVDVLRPNTFMDYAIVERLVPPDFHKEYRSFNIGELLLQGSDKENIPLHPDDVILVFNQQDLIEKKKVRVTGAVNRVGEFEYRPNMKVSDLLKLAGGLKKFAFTEAAELTRVVPTREGPKTDQIIVSLSEAMAGDPQHDISLEEDDYLFVRSVPDWNLYRKVTVYGEVKFPGEYALKKGEKISSLLERAGGFTDKAYLRGSTFTRLSVKNLQQKQVLEMVNRLERELLAMGSAEVSSAMTPEEAQLIQLENKQKQLFIASLKEVEAKGRMVVSLDEPAKLKLTDQDLELEEGDSITIPANPQTVQVIGAVYNASSYIYNVKRDFSYYVDLSGGYTPTADKDRVYVMKVDGSSSRPKGGMGRLFWDGDSNKWRSGFTNVVEPGDTIVVPDKLEKVAWLRETKDLTQILYQIATTAGVALLAF